MLAPGLRFGRYVIERHIGAGGMGDVYLARDTLLDRHVALKVVRAAGAGDALDPGGQEGERATVTYPPPRADHTAPQGRASRARARFLREARAAAALLHPNVVAVFDVGEIDGIAYLAMEHVDGVSLRAHVERGDLPMERRVEVIRDVARALAAAHARGVIHRDVKPENVLLAAPFATKVADFGIAKRSDEHDGETPPAVTPLTEPGGVVGTPAYMAPEQIRDALVDARADQFAWGVLAFELLAGAHPFARAAGPTATTAAILEDDAPDLRARVPGVEPRVAGVVARALAKRPDQRFPSMDELVRALEREERAAAPSGRSVRARVAAAAVVIGAAALLARGLGARPAAPAPTREAAAAPASSAPAVPSGEGSSVGSAAAPPPPVRTADAPKAAAPPPAPSSAPRPLPPAVAPARTAPSAAAPKPACNPPYEVDAQGTKKWKVECL